MQGPWSGQYSSAQPIVPNDIAPAVNCRAIFATGAGNITAVQGPLGAQGPAEVFVVTAGEILPLELNQGIVKATGTTATGLIALA